MSNLPGEEELKRLSLRALVAYAARCARRAETSSLLLGNYPGSAGDLQAASNAISIAEDFASGAPIAFAAANKLGLQAKAIAEQSTDYIASNAILAAAEAAFSAYAASTDFATSNAIQVATYSAAIDQGISNIESVFPKVRAIHTLNFAARSAGFAARSNASTAEHAAKDFAQLETLNLTKWPEVGDPIIPFESGPLGQLWDLNLPRQYFVSQQHPFYDEMLQFCVSLFSLQAVLIVLVIRSALQRKQIPIMPDVNGDVQIDEVGCKQGCIINMAAVNQYMTTAANRPARLSFEMRPYFGALPIDPGVGRKLDTHTDESLQTLTAYLVGGAFERQAVNFETKYGPRGQWNPELQFFRHLRNGCFHGNHFNIEPVLRKNKPPQDQIDPMLPPKWGPYVMASDATMNTQTAMNGFFKIPYLLQFLYDMGVYV